MNLKSKHCLPCSSYGSPLLLKQATTLAKQVPTWILQTEQEPYKLKKTWTFKDFSHAIDFVNRVAAIAEEEGHHPTIHVSWNVVTLMLWTHALKGLTENDFICAAKIDTL